MLLVSNSQLKASMVTSFVETTQVAPTILQALGIDPNNLDPAGVANGPYQLRLSATDIGGRSSRAEKLSPPGPSAVRRMTIT
jgi:hypothetical protein